MRSKIRCVSNDDRSVSLTVGKVYDRIPDEMAEDRGFVRVLDDTEDDYLFPAEWFEDLDGDASWDAILSDPTSRPALDSVVSDVDREIADGKAEPLSLEDL